MEDDLMTFRLWTLKPPKYICLWAAIFVNLTRYRISYLRPTGRKGFWATTEAGPEMALNS